MVDTLTETLDKLDKLLQSIVVAGLSSHVTDTINDLQQLGYDLQALGVPALAEPVLALCESNVSHSAGELATRVAAVWRAADRARLWLLSPVAPNLSQAGVEIINSVYVVPARSWEEALAQPSDICWAMAREELEQEPDPDMIERLIAWAETGPIVARRRAIEALGSFPTPESTRTLVDLLGDPDVLRDVRCALLRHGAVEPLSAVLLQREENSGKVRRAAQLLYYLDARDTLIESSSAWTSDHIVRCYLALAQGEPFALEASRSSPSLSTPPPLLRPRLGQPPPRPAASPDLSEASAGQALPLARIAELLYQAESAVDVSDELIESIFALRHEALRVLASFLADTPTGDRLLALSRGLMIGHAPPPRRRKANMLLGFLGTPQDVSLLIHDARNGLPQAFPALAMLGGEHVFQFLCKVIETRIPPERIGPAIRALGQLGDARCVPLLALCLSDRQHHRDAATALGVIGDPGAVDPLCARLRQVQPHETDTYVRALVQVNDPRAVDGLVVAIVGFPGRISGARNALTSGLVHFGDAAVERVAELLTHQDPRLHAIAEEVLHGINTENSLQALNGYLQRNPMERLLARLMYASRTVQQQAKHELQQMNGEQLAEFLDLARTGDVSAQQLEVLLTAIRHRRDPELVPVLNKMADSQHQPMAQRALDILTGYPYGVSRDRLVDRLGAGQPASTRKAVQALGHQDVTVADKVMPLLKHGTPSARIGALQVLTAGKARWAIEQVLPLLDQPDLRVRRAAISSLPRLSVPRLQEQIINKLIDLLRRGDRELVLPIADALGAMVAGTGRDDVHQQLALAWSQIGRTSHRILMAIGMVGHPAARQLLETELHRQPSDAQRSAMIGLARLGDQAAIPALEQVFNNPSSSRLLKAAEENIGRIRDKQHYLYSAEMAINRGDYTAAQDSTTAYVEVNPGDSIGYLRRGRAYHLASELEAAWEDYHRASDLAPGQAGGWRGLALVAHALNDLEQARQFYERALPLARGDVALRFCRGLLHLQMGAREAARSDFRMVSGMRTVQSGYSSSDIPRRIAQTMENALSHLGSGGSHVIDASELMAALARPLPDMLGDLGLCWLYGALGEFEQAIVCARRLIEAWPDMRPHGQLLIWWLQMGLGQVEDAQTTLQTFRNNLAHRGWHWCDLVQYGLGDWPLDFPVLLPSATAALVALRREPKDEGMVST